MADNPPTAHEEELKQGLEAPKLDGDVTPTMASRALPALAKSKSASGAGSGNTTTATTTTTGTGTGTGTTGTTITRPTTTVASGTATTGTSGTITTTNGGRHRKHSHSHSQSSHSKTDYDAELLSVLQEFRRAKARQSSVLASLTGGGSGPSPGSGLGSSLGSGGSASASGGGGPGLTSDPILTTTTTNHVKGESTSTTTTTLQGSSFSDPTSKHPSLPKQAAENDNPTRHRSNSHSHTRSRSTVPSSNVNSHHPSNGTHRLRSPSPPPSSSLLLTLTNERLAYEQTRASSAERQVSELLVRLKDLREAYLRKDQEARMVREELELYKVQLDVAQKEILKAQEIVAQVDQQRVAAEIEAAKNRNKLRKVLEEKLLKEALEEGRREGYREGLEEGRYLAVAELQTRRGESRSRVGTSGSGSGSGSRTHARSQSQSQSGQRLPLREEEEDDLPERQRRPRRNTLGANSHEAHPHERAKTIPRPSTSIGHRRYAVDASPPPPLPLPLRSKTPGVDPSRSRSRARSSSRAQRVPDTAPFAPPLPVPTLTTPQPLEVPATHPQPQPPRSAAPGSGQPDPIAVLPSSSRGGAASGSSSYGNRPTLSNSNNNNPTSSNIQVNNAAGPSNINTSPTKSLRSIRPLISTYTPRVTHPDVQLPPDGFIPTLNPVDGSINLPPPHELNAPVLTGGGGVGGGGGGGGGNNNNNAAAIPNRNDTKGKGKGKARERADSGASTRSYGYFDYDPTSNEHHLRNIHASQIQPDDDYDFEDQSLISPMMSMHMYSSTPRHGRRRGDGHYDTERDREDRGDAISFGASTHISQYNLVSHPTGSEVGSDSARHSASASASRRRQRRDQILLDGDDDARDVTAHGMGHGYGLGNDHHYRSRRQAGIRRGAGAGVVGDDEDDVFMISANDHDAGDGDGGHHRHHRHHHDPDEEFSISFGNDFLAHNQRNRGQSQNADGGGQSQNQLLQNPNATTGRGIDRGSRASVERAGAGAGKGERYVVPPTPETPTPIPNLNRSGGTRPRAQTQGQEMAAHWRLQNPDVVSSFSVAGEVMSTSSSRTQPRTTNSGVAGIITTRERERGKSISSRMGPGLAVPGEGKASDIQRPKTVEPSSRSGSVVQGSILSPRQQHEQLHPHSQQQPRHLNQQQPDVYPVADVRVNSTRVETAGPTITTTTTNVVSDPNASRHKHLESRPDVDVGSGISSGTEDPARFQNHQSSLSSSRFQTPPNNNSGNGTTNPGYSTTYGDYGYGSGSGYLSASSQRRAPNIHRTFTSGTTPEIGVEPPSKSPSSISEGGSRFLDPVLLTPDGIIAGATAASSHLTSSAQGYASQTRSHPDEEHQVPYRATHPQTQTYVGYYTAPTLPRFEYEYDYGVYDGAKPPMASGNNNNNVIINNDDDKTDREGLPGFVVPLSPIPSMTNLRPQGNTPANAGLAGIYYRPKFDSSDYGRLDRSHGPGGGSQQGDGGTGVYYLTANQNQSKDDRGPGRHNTFFSPAPLNRPISLFSDTS